MVKLRDARYCNLKLFLIYLVIYGHLIEPEIRDSPALMTRYRWIYLFHMPLFSFLSGLFLNHAGACKNQLRRLFPIYILLQAVAVVLGSGQVKTLTPYWYLWYLLSCSTWSALGWLWFRFGKGRGKFLILAASVLMGCAAGYVPAIGREWSLSRTLVFFPYFWLGLLCDRKFPWERLRLPGLAALGIVILLMAGSGNNISVVFLYQAAAYGGRRNGFWLRLLCYLIGTLLGLFLLAFMPTKRFPFTRAGADTMPAYLLHGPVALYFRELELPWASYLLIAGAYLYAVYKIPQWHRRLYGIVPSERRDSPWRSFRRSMKNTPSRSTASCCPCRETRT